MPSILGILAGLAASAIWGGMYVVSKVVLAVIPPFALLSLRLLLGSLALLPILLWQRRLRLTGSEAGRLLAVGAVGFGLSLGLQFVGTHLSTASNAALVTSASPAFMVVFALILLRERVSSRRLAALILASAGVLAVIDPASARLDSSAFAGNLALVGAAITWGLYSILVKQAAQRSTVLQIGLYTFLGGLMLAAPAAWLESRGLPLGSIDLNIVLGVLYLGVVSTALAMVLWTVSLAQLPAAVVSILFFAQPLVGAALGAWLLGESLTLVFWVGAALIAAGVLLSAAEPMEQDARSAGTGDHYLEVR